MGKSGSKLKKKDRSQSITWSFRFPSLVSLSSRRKMPASGPHLDIGHWLTILDLSQYAHLFDTYSGVEDLLNFSEADIKELGVKNAAHRARMVSSLVALRNKYDKGARKAEKASQRHSVAVDSSRLDNKVTESDILVVSNVIQSKSLCNIRMEATGDGGDPAALRKALEWELSLDTRDLRSHAWYHGAIPRTRAEEIVREPGQFLVRDCTSQPGNYVLTCRTLPSPLHFVINKVVIQPDTVYERVQYQFEDEPFDTVPDLITYYVGSGKSVTAHSRAKITTPCNRMYPLSFYATKYGGLGSQRASPLASPLTASRPGSQNSGHSPAHSPPRTKRDLPPRLPSKKKSLPETNGKPGSRVDERSTSADGVILDHMSRSMGAEVLRPHNDFSAHSLPRRAGAGMKTPLGASTMPRNVKVSRGTSDPGLSPSLERKPYPGEEEGPPPKPSVRPLLLKLDDHTDHYNTFHTRVSTYHASGSDSGNGSGDSAQSSDVGEVPPPRPGGVIIKNPRYGVPPSSSSTTLKACEYDSALEDSLTFSCLPIDLPSSFDLENFQTLLLPTLENKPLDATALEGVKMRLRDTGSRILANHLTRVDLELTTGSEKTSSWDDFSVTVNSGIELSGLPFGHRMRLDLIERTVCLKLLVAVTILTCPAEAERAETLNKWIQVAIDTKTALGNLFGFNAIMLGLCMPQIQRLTVTWHILRQKFTDSAFNFEAKLRPTLKSMNECTNPLAPNTTIPHLLPYLLIQERDWDEMLDLSSCNHLPESSCLTSWESGTPDSGLSTLWAHLDAARKYTESVSTFRRNSEIVLGDSKVDELLLEMFRTEFHLKFLWGSRGAGFHASERYAKFEQVVTVMSGNCEPPNEPTVNPHTAPPSYNPAIGTSV